MKTNRIVISLFAAFAGLILFTACISQPAVSGTMSLDEAIESAALAIEERVAGGSAIAVYKITASIDEIGEYLAEDLNDRISMRGNLNPLAREAALRYVDTEQEFQISGLVSDESAVGIGHYIGAEVVVSGYFNHYADFSQLRLRAVDVLTSSLLVSYTVRINNADRILANISATFGTIQAPRITENALTHLNRGKDFFAECLFEEAIVEFDQAIAINRNLAEAYFYRGTAYSHKSEDDKATADLDQAIHLNFNPLFLAYNNLGAAYVNMGDWDRALIYADQAMRLNSDNDWVYTVRAMSLNGIGEHDRAITDFTQAIRLNPYNFRAYQGRSMAYIDKEEYNLAIRDATEAIRLNPFEALPYYHRALAYKLIEDYNNAIKDYTMAFQLDPENPIMFGAYNNRGEAYFAIGDLDKALADFTLAIRLNPNYSIAYSNRGYVYHEINDFDKAIMDYTQAIRLNPNVEDLYANRSMAYFSMGDMERATMDLVQAIRLTPDGVDLYNLHGIGAYNNGHIDLAIITFEAVLRVNPNHTNARNNLEVARQQRGR